MKVKAVAGLRDTAIQRITWNDFAVKTYSFPFYFQYASSNFSTYFHLSVRFLINVHSL